MHHTTVSWNKDKPSLERSVILCNERHKTDKEAFGWGEIPFLKSVRRRKVSTGRKGRTSEGNKRAHATSRDQKERRRSRSPPLMSGGKKGRLAVIGSGQPGRGVENRSLSSTNKWRRSRPPDGNGVRRKACAEHVRETKETAATPSVTQAWWGGGHDSFLLK